MRWKSIIPLTCFLIILAVIYITLKPFKQNKEVTQKNYLWQIDESTIFRIKIFQPGRGKGESFIKDKSGKWYFDNERRTPVALNRWGGGIPLLLGGPSANRIVTEKTTETKKNEYGLNHPRMTVTIEYNGDKSMELIIGDPTPNNKAFYILVPNSDSVATVDHSWYDVFERLITDPPY